MESQLIARQIDGTNDVVFEIFSQNPTNKDSWVRHCIGSLSTNNSIEPWMLDFPFQIHDEALLNQANVYEPGIGTGLDSLKLSSTGSSGEFKHNEDVLGAYPVDPTILNTILRLPPTSLLNQRLPAEYRLSSVASLTLVPQLQRSSCGQFHNIVKPLGSYSVESDSEIRPSENVVLLRGMRYQVSKETYQKSALSSLFFKPVLLPDITTLSAAEPMTISRCAELLTHKWPMCDIKIDDVSERCTVLILNSFGATTGEARSYFRSIKCSSIPPGVITDRVHLIDCSDMDSKYHFIITQHVPLAGEFGDQLNRRGLICIPKTRMQELRCEQDSPLAVVCDIIGLGSDSWVLLRMTTNPDEVSVSRRFVVFANEHELRFREALGKSERVDLKPAPVACFCKKNSSGSFDAVVIDSPKKPIATTWTGTELLPWLQTLLTSARGILWVTQNGYENPFSNVAGSLLRTLQSEQPSIKVSWLLVDGSTLGVEDIFASQVENAYTRMLEGEDEILRETRGSGETILRYIPNDCLSAYAGLGFPLKTRDVLGKADYSLGLAAARRPIILSYKSAGNQALSRNAIEVCVEASVVDNADLQMLDHESFIENSRSTAGCFFAGSVQNSHDAKLLPGTRVVGWHPDHIHRKKVSVHLDDVCGYPSSINPSQAVSRFAVSAVALCIVDGAARARRGETILAFIQGPLLNAVKQVCDCLGASVVDLISGSKADFVIDYQCLGGICVNNRPIDLAHYLQSEHGRAVIYQRWQDLPNVPVETDEYELVDYEKAIINTKEPYSTVLLHRNVAKIVDHVPIYRKAPLMFTSHASYIVIGGLGGLGRFICTWMIENGARHITIISRSGAGTQYSRDAISAMETCGAFVQCIRSDACNRQIMSEIVCKLRCERPIKGIINLAMVLGDAPIATMTPEEWDGVLRVKIDSSWILHEETLQDQLDFFILFSSIASVLGNRNQGNYNVANACLNSLAGYRQSLDLPGISVALGAMSKFSRVCSSSSP